MTTILVGSHCGTDLSSRHCAAELRRSVESYVEHGDVVNLDFADVRSISSSFADELFGILVGRHGEQWFREHVRVGGLSTLSRRVVLEAVATRVPEKV